MAKSVLENGGYLGLSATYGQTLAPYLKGWTQATPGSVSSVTIPPHVPGDLILIVGQYGYGYAPTGWTLALPSAVNSCHVYYKTATSTSEVSGNWGGSFLRMYAFVFSGAMSIGAAAGYDPGYPYAAADVAVNISCPDITATDLSGKAIRLRFATVRVQGYGLTSWVAPLPSQYTLLSETSGDYKPSRVFIENSTRFPSPTSVSAGQITHAAAEYVYHSTATVEIRGV